MSDNLLFKPREKNLLHQKSVTELQETTLKLLFLLYFSKQVSLSPLSWKWKNISKQNYAGSALPYCCLVKVHCTADLFSVLCWSVLCANVILQGLSLHNASQPTTKTTGCEIFSTWYHTQPGVAVLATKNRPVMTWYSFFSHKSFFWCHYKPFNYLNDIKTNFFLGGRGLVFAP